MTLLSTLNYKIEATLLKNHSNRKKCEQLDVHISSKHADNLVQLATITLFGGTTRMLCSETYTVLLISQFIFVFPSHQFVYITSNYLTVHTNLLFFGQSDLFLSTLLNSQMSTVIQIAYSVFISDRVNALSCENTKT